MLYLHIPGVFFVTTYMNGHPFVLHVHLQLAAADTHIDKLSHQVIGNRVPVGAIADGGIFIHPQLHLFTADKLHGRMLAQEVLLLREQFVGALAYSLLLPRIEPFKRCIKLLLGLQDVRKGILGGERFTADILHAPFHVTFFVSTAYVAKAMPELIVPPKLEQ